MHYEDPNKEVDQFSHTYGEYTSEPTERSREIDPIARLQLLEERLFVAELVLSDHGNYQEYRHKLDNREAGYFFELLHPYRITITSWNPQAYAIDTIVDWEPKDESLSWERTHETPAAFVFSMALSGVPLFVRLLAVLDASNKNGELTLVDGPAIPAGVVESTESHETSVHDLENVPNIVIRDLVLTELFKAWIDMNADDTWSTITVPDVGDFDVHIDAESDPDDRCIIIYGVDANGQAATGSAGLRFSLKP